MGDGSVKHSSCKHEDFTLILCTHVRKARYIGAHWAAGDESLWAHCSASLAYLVCSRPMRDPNSKKYGVWLLRNYTEVVLWPAHAHRSTHMFTKVMELLLGILGNLQICPFKQVVSGAFLSPLIPVAEET